MLGRWSSFRCLSYERSGDGLDLLMEKRASLICPLCQSIELSPISMIKESSPYFLCRQCDLRFLDSKFRLDPEEEKARYLQHNNDVSDVRYQEFLKPLFNLVLPHLGKKAQGLDYGAGTGPALAKMFESQGFPMALYDPFFWMDESVLRRSYDFIVCSEVAEHFYNPSIEFERIKSLLIPGGVLGLMTSLYISEIDFQTWYYRKDPTHVVFYSEKTLGWIAEKFKLQLVSVQSDRLILFKSEDLSD